MILNRQRVKRIFLVSLILVSYFIFTYCTFFGFQFSLIGTIFIGVFSFLCWPHHWKSYLGITVQVKTAATAAIILIAVSISAFFIIKLISTENGVPFDFHPDMIFPGSIHTLFQALNEELILGALLLFSLQRRFRKVPAPVLSLIIALLFALLHFVFYLLVRENNRGTLDILTVVNLFLVGFIRNNLILHFRQIWYSWALHAGWNLIFLGPFFSITHNESQRFNLFLGSPYTLLFTGCLLFLSSVCLLLLRKRHLHIHAGTNKS